MRIQVDGTNVIASGDLYLHQINSSSSILLVEPNPSQGIPIFAISKYRYYLKVIKIQQNGDNMIITFEKYRYEYPNIWLSEGTFQAVMTRVPAPIGFPSSSDYYTGSISDNMGTVVGNLTMGWVSKYLRRATIEIDKVSESEWPVNNGSGINWSTIFDSIDWDITLIQSSSDIEEPSEESWSKAELHSVMLSKRDSSNLNTDWHYHVLCVRKLDNTDRGLMYDNYGTDSNNVPREGVGICSHWIIPNEDLWGLTKGVRFGTATDLYFRTAIHEIGHAMGLYHNTIDNGIMNATNSIAEKAVPPVQFPKNIQWSYAADDQKRLRHFPDLWIRPGGVSWGNNYPSIISDDYIFDDENLEMKVSAELETIPLGAPVSINFSLINNSDELKRVPKELGLENGNITGKVIDPSGTERIYSPIILCLDEEDTSIIGKDESINGSITLLRGAQGALFPLAGVYNIIVEASWETNGLQQRSVGTTNVMVTPPVDEDHAKAAYKIISNPDSLLVLAIGGDHLKKGLEAIEACLENSVLKPHYSIIEAKRVGKKFGKRRPDLELASKMITNETIMTSSEIKSFAKIVKKEKNNISDEIVKKINGVLMNRLGNKPIDAESKKFIESI